MVLGRAAALGHDTGGWEVVDRLLESDAARVSGGSWHV